MDLQLRETGNGGDFIKKPKDLSIIYGFQNMVYLALFGGNVLASTPVRRIESEQAFDYWGNTLLWKDDPSVQFNSETERTLNNVAINSSGRITIEEAVKKDLQFMRSFATVEVNVSLLGLDKIQIDVSLVKPDNIQRVEYKYIWDSTVSELIEMNVSGDTSIGTGFRIFE